MTEPTLLPASHRARILELEAEVVGLREEIKRIEHLQEDVDKLAQRGWFWHGRAREWTDQNHALQTELARLREENERLWDEVAELELEAEIRAQMDGAEIARLREALERIADPEEFDAGWQLMRECARNALTQQEEA